MPRRLRLFSSDFLEYAAQPVGRFQWSIPPELMPALIPPNPRQLEITEHPTPPPKLGDRAGQINAGDLFEFGLSAETVTERVEDLPVRGRDRYTRHKIISGRWR